MCEAVPPLDGITSLSNMNEIYFPCAFISIMRRGGSHSVVTGLWTGPPGLDSRQGLKCAWREADNSPPSSAELRMHGAILPLPHSSHGVALS
jgi:hypothetical protein